MHKKCCASSACPILCGHAGGPIQVSSHLNALNCGGWTEADRGGTAGISGLCRQALTALIVCIVCTIVANLTEILCASAPAALIAVFGAKAERCGTCNAGGERSLEDYTFTGSKQSAEASLADQAAQSAAASTFEVSADFLCRSGLMLPLLRGHTASACPFICRRQFALRL